jgi:hypothetical protein
MVNLSKHNILMTSDTAPFSEISATPPSARIGVLRTLNIASRARPQYYCPKFGEGVKRTLGNIAVPALEAHINHTKV